MTDRAQIRRDFIDGLDGAELSEDDRAFVLMCLDQALRREATPRGGAPPREEQPSDVADWAHLERAARTVGIGYDKASNAYEAALYAIRQYREAGGGASPRDPEWLMPALVQHLRELGCTCDTPLVGYSPGYGPRCRLCNVDAAPGGGAPPRREENERVRAEALWEELGGDLCICQHEDVPHWCEKCQQRIGYVRTVFGHIREEGAASRESTYAALVEMERERDAETRRAEAAERERATLQAQLGAAQEALRTFGKHVAGCKRGLVVEPVACPSCGEQMRRVRNMSGYLNDDQFDAVKIGDWFCKRHDVEVVYVWDKDLAKHDCTCGLEAAFRSAPPAQELKS